MMDVLIVGGDSVVQEGVLQAVRAAGLRAEWCPTGESAREAAADVPPTALVVHVDIAGDADRARQIPLRSGGAVILFRDGERSGESAEQVFGRTVIAELSLPLERTRLIALLNRIVERARITGRDRRIPDPPLSP
jgi:DNA-binding NtrC family response regulator